MKGVSTIIAVILLLMITVALVAVFWNFSGNIFGSISQNVGKQTDASITRSGTEFSIINARNTSSTSIDVTIRNSGTQNINLDTLVAFVDDNTTSETAAGTLAPGGSSAFTVTSPYSMTKCDHVLRLSVAYASDSYYTVKSVSPLCT